MSHDATNWAVKVRGIPPAAKVVLWHLADRHNKDNGRCDPSQDRLADDCEVSRSSLNNQLRILEQGGLIKRVQRSNSDTKRKKTTHYILFMNRTEPQDIDGRVQDLDTEAVSKFRPKPCPNSGQSRVQNLDINPGTKPVKEPYARTHARARHGDPPAPPAESGRTGRQPPEDISNLIADLQRKAKGHGKGIERRKEAGKPKRRALI